MGLLYGRAGRSAAKKRRSPARAVAEALKRVRTHADVMPAAQLEQVLAGNLWQYHITRPLAPPHSLHTVLLKVESCNAHADDEWLDPVRRAGGGVLRF